MEEFIKLSLLLGKNTLYVQGAGGNSSLKIGNKLYIKASGEKMKNIKINHGYVCCKIDPIAAFLTSKKKYLRKDEQEFIHVIEDHMILEESYGYPSMETGFHAIIPSLYVFHLHSVYVNIFTCMKQGSRVIKKLFSDTPLLILDYKNPGYELAHNLLKYKSLPSLIFLKNHGVIIHGDDAGFCLKLIRSIHTKIERYLVDHNAFVPFTVSKKHIKMDNYSFPDAAVYASIQVKDIPNHKKNDLLEIGSAQQYIVHTVNRLGKNPTFLSNNAIKKLLAMKQEKHRIELFKK